MKRYVKFIIAAIVVAVLILATIFFGFEFIGFVVLAMLLCLPTLLYSVKLSKMTKQEYEEFVKRYFESTQYLNHRPFDHDTFL